MSKAGTGFPTENRNPERVAQRVKRDLLWIIFGLAAALVAAAAAYTLLPN